MRGSATNAIVAPGRPCAYQGSHAHRWGHAWSGRERSVAALLAERLRGTTSPIARRIYELATAHGKRVQALGGAKNHAIVLPDADLDLTADGLISAGYGSAGQRCMAVSVAVAVGDIADRLVEMLAERIDRLIVGPGSDPEAEMGAPRERGPSRPCRRLR
jgi:delta 1-pyrroline-5-carboxylate dehydrogenase